LRTVTKPVSRPCQICAPGAQRDGQRPGAVQWSHPRLLHHAPCRARLLYRLPEPARVPGRRGRAGVRPCPATRRKLGLTARGLYDPALSLRLEGRAVGNDVEADGQRPETPAKAVPLAARRSP